MATEGAILVVDDDAVSRHVLGQTLANAGLATVMVGSGIEAMAWLERQMPALVLLDLVMPELSGADVLRILATEQPDLPVVVASGYKRELASDRLGREGAFALVQKPFDADGLCAILRDALRKSQMARAMQRSGT